MPLITIREEQQTDLGFGAMLSIEGRNYAITISNSYYFHVTVSISLL